MAREYVQVARYSALPENRGKKVRIRGEEVALWRVNGRVYAISNVCAHQHISDLHAGVLCGLAVTCPMHGWTYALETGQATVGSGRVRTFPVVVRGDLVYVETEDGEGE